MSRLLTRTIRNSTAVTDVASGARVFHVSDPHALVQAAGYLKYIHGLEGKHVFYRGQAGYYNALQPSMVRGYKTANAQNKRTAALARAIKLARAKAPILGNLPEPVIEPLLQHYGLRTSWIDLVDNIWIALWFACHRAHAAGEGGKYLHFERRTSRLENEDRRYAYLLLVAVDAVSGPTRIAGLWKGADTELVDLRIAAPSTFLRPHAQHGVLFRLNGVPGSRPLDYQSSVVGSIRVSLDDALDWLGEGKLVNVHALFPPPHYDAGYDILLKEWSELFGPASLIGLIHHIGA